MVYDANGNVTNMPGVGTLAYDARNRITGAGGVPTRGYDPGNRKIWWKDSNGITFVDYWLPNGEKLVTYRIDESPYYNNWQSYTGPVQFSTVVRNLYFAGRRVKVEGGPGAGWLQPDRLSSNARHHPYGEERGTSSTEYKFATYQREASGLDYALNRYYSSVYGRFLSSDPYRASGGPRDPGSWNRYAHVQGDPINYSDPEGLSALSVSIALANAFSVRTPSVTVSDRVDPWLPGWMFGIFAYVDSVRPTQRGSSPGDAFAYSQCMDNSQSIVEQARKEFLAGAQARINEAVRNAPSDAVDDAVLSSTVAMIVGKAAAEDLIVLAESAGGGPYAVVVSAFVILVMESTAAALSQGLVGEPLMQRMYDKYIYDPSMRRMADLCRPYLPDRYDHETQ